MPRPLADFLRPLPTLPKLPQLGGGGSSGYQSPLAERDPFNISDYPVDAYMPTEEGIETAQKVDNGANFFFDIMSFPSKIFGSIKPAFAGDLRQAALNNPISGAIAGISDIFNLGLKQKIGYKDIPFSVVREAWGQTNTDKGFLNGVVNFVGELVTDPSTFWFPFGKTGAIEKVNKSTHVFGFLGKGAKKPFTPAERVPGLLGLGKMDEPMELVRKTFIDDLATLPLDKLKKAEMTEVTRVLNGVGDIEAIRRTFFVFRLPFTDIGFYLRLQNVDNAVARFIEVTGDFLYQNPVTKPLMKFFTGLPSVLASGKDSSGPGRRLMRYLLSYSQEAGSDYRATFRRTLAAIAHTNQELLKDPEHARLFNFLAEIGVEAFDKEAAVDRKIGSLGLTYRAVKKRNAYLAEKPQHLEDYTFALEELKKGNPQHARKWMDEHPDLAFPVHYLYRGGIKPRHGVDIYQPSLAPEILGTTETLERAVGSEVMSRVGSEAVQAERQAAQMLPSNFRTKIQEDVAGEMKQLWSDLTGKEKEKMVQAVASIREMGKKMRIWEQSEGLLNYGTLYYIPHELSDRARKFIDGHVKDVLKSSYHDRGVNLYEDYVDKLGREFSNWTIEEVNSFYAQLGGKQTIYIPMKDLPADSFLGTEDKLFGGLSTLMRSLSKKDKLDKVSWNGLKEFFGTNTYGQWYRRIDRAAMLVEKNTLIRRALDADAPWIFGEINIAELADPRWQQTIVDHALVPMVTLARNHTKQVEWGEVMEKAVHIDRISRVDLTRFELENTGMKSIISGKYSYRTYREHLAKMRDLEVGEDITPELGDSSMVAMLKSWLHKKEILINSGETGGKAKSKLKYIDGVIAELRNGINDELDSLARDTDKWLKMAIGGTRQTLRNIRQTVLDTSGRDKDLALWRIARKRGGALPLDEIRNLNPEAYEKLVERGGKVTLVNKEVAEGIFGDGGFIENLYKVDPWRNNGFIAALDNFTSFWKAITIGLPIWTQTRSRDFISNLRMGMLAGLTPKDITLGAHNAARATMKIQKYMRGEDIGLLGTITRKAGVGEGPDEVDLTEFIRVGDRMGALNSSWTADMMTEALSEGVLQNNPLLRKKWYEDVWKLWDPSSGAYRAGLGEANWIDNFSKQLLAHSFWRKGLSLEDAWATAMHYSYDPRGMRLPQHRYVLRRFVPFASWIKKATEITAEAYYRSPGAITWWDKLRKVSYESLGIEDPEHFEDMMPRFIRDFLGIPFNKTKDGTVEYALFGGYFPEGNLAEAANAFEWFFSDNQQDSFVNAILSNFNPALKVFIENWRNESSFTGTDIERHPGETQRFWGMSLPPKWINILRQVRLLQQLDKLIAFDKDDVDALVAAWKYRFEKSKSTAMTFLTSAFGPLMRTYNIDVERSARRSWQRINFAKAKATGQMRRNLASGKSWGEKEAKTLQEHLTRLTAEQRDIEEVSEQFLE